VETLLYWCLSVTIYNEYCKRIEKQILPSSHPLAIKMLKDKGEIPHEAKRPTKDYGACLATCQVFALSRKYGETVAQLFEDMWCPEPVIGYGLAAPPSYFLEGHNRYPDGVASLAAGSNWAREYPRFETGKYIGILSAPLRTASFEPDVAIFYCNSAQLLRLLLGIAYQDGRDLSVVLGGHAACVYGVVPPIQKKQCWVSVPCRGDRGRAGTQDDEVIFSVPKDQIGRLAHGLEQPGTGSLPTAISMTAEYALSESYAEMARQMGMLRSDGSRIEGYSAEDRRLALQYRQVRSDAT
jgi:uncharacterized protein (DUF169 family)